MTEFPIADFIEKKRTRIMCQFFIMKENNYFHNLQMSYL